MCINVFFAGPGPQLPIEGPWRQASLKSFLKNMDAGKEETGKPAASPLLLSGFRMKVATPLWFRM